MTHKNVLLTGGFGFVGSHLIELLLREPETHLHVVDNLVTSPIDPEAYLNRLGRPARVTFDLCSVEEYCARSTSRPRFDEIFHLASVVGPVGVLQHAGRIAQQIIGDTYRVIELATADSARLIDVSTSEVYGGGRDGYCSEKDAKIIPPRNSVRLEYAVAKLASEVALMNLVTVGKLQAVIVRPFNIAGPRQAPAGGFVLPRFIGQALKGEPLTVYADGSMIRAFTHVKAIANGIVLAARRGQPGEAYNLGNPANKTSILDLARRVVRITETKSEVVFVDPKKLFGPLFEEANDKYPDADRAIRELGWDPGADIDTVIRDALEYILAGRRD
jgi:UDP-glucose 4-epimerase